MMLKSAIKGPEHPLLTLLYCLHYGLWTSIWLLKVALIIILPGDLSSCLPTDAAFLTYFGLPSGSKSARSKYLLMILL